MKVLLEKAKQYEEEIITARRYFHKNAEINMDLPLTTKYVMDKLTEMGYEPVEICQSGVLAVAGGKKPGKTFLLRGDMDALPIKEEANVEFKSITNNMHACGHDLHTAMLLGAAKLLKEHENEIEGTVKLMFQPGEETLTGAKLMVEAGILENPNVDAAIMIHVFSGMPIPSGVVIFSGSGIISATSDWFEIKVNGKGGHGAMPNTTIDPLNALSHIHIALGEINSRELEPGEVGVVTVGEMHGGNAGNVIPDSAYMRGTIRTFDDNTREFVKQRVEEISNGIASTFRCKAKVELSRGCPSVVNDKELGKDIFKYTAELLGQNAVVDAERAFGSAKRMSGSEDFAFLSQKVPTLMIGMSASQEVDGEIYPQHHPKVVFDENVLPIGSAVYANAAIEWLKEHK